MIDKRGQAAMEFLMTYGWAILAAVIAIGVLAYMGVFSGSSQDLVMINLPFSDAEQSVNSTSIHLIARQGAGDTINITNVSIAGCGANYNAAGTLVANGEKMNMVVTCSPALTGKQFRGGITITYKKADAVLPTDVTGSINAKVKA